MNKLKGIDVSKHNGKVDWERIKAAGINFAIIRIGYGNDTINQDDPQAARNMSECERLGIPYGVYLYSYALTVEEAHSEAEHMLRMIKDRNPKMGIWFDLEDADGHKIKNNLPLDKANKNIYNEITAAFITDIQIAGYNHVGIYASKHIFDTILNKDFLTYSGCKVWVAQWNEKCTYTGIYEMWQYSDCGSIPGSSERTDMNYYYGEIKDNLPGNPAATSVKVENKQPTSIPQTTKPAYKYKVGQRVRFSTCYKSSTAGNEKAIGTNKMLRNNGVITCIKDGARNPYLLDGGLCWVNDGDIREVL